VLEVALNVVLHRPEQREPPRVAEHVEVDVIAQSGAVLVDEVLHADIVGVLRCVEIPFEGVARAGFVPLEGRLVRLEVGHHLEPIAVLEEDPIVGVEVREAVVVLGPLAEVPEEPLEDVGHEVPRGAHVEGEALGL